MAKFIIEVDDEYIREKADPETAKKKMDPNGSGGNVMKAMFDMIAFSAIERRLDEGMTEFRVTRDMMSDDNRRDLFDRNIADVLMLAFMAQPDRKEG